MTVHTVLMSCGGLSRGSVTGILVQMDQFYYGITSKNGLPPEKFIRPGPVLFVSAIAVLSAILMSLASCIGMTILSVRTQGTTILS